MDLDYLIGYLIGLGTILLTGKPLLRGLEQEANKVAPNAILDRGSALEAWKRGALEAGDLSDELAQEGLDQNRVEILQILSETLLSAGDSIVSFYRGEISPDELSSNLKKLGFSATSAKLMTANFETRLQAQDLITAEWRGLQLPEEIGTAEAEVYGSGLTKGRLDLLRQIALRIPSIADLFQFSAWNITDDSFAEKFGLDQLMPSDFIAACKKNGIGEDYAKKLWRSHWQPVPIFILKELYGTGQISDEQLLALFNVYQIPPGFQEAIKAAFSKQLSEAQLVGGVQNGSIPEAGLDTYIAALGYAPSSIPIVHAEIMTKAAAPSAEEKAAAAASREQYKSLTVGGVIAEYKEQIITRDQATTYLKDLNVSDDIIQFQLNHADWLMKNAALKDNITAIEDQFLKGDLDAAAATSQLSALGLSAVKITNLIDKWTKAVPGAAKQFSKSDIDAFLKKGTITIGQYVALMMQIGYDAEHILLYYAYLAGKSITDAQTDLASYIQ